jgi:hypothetical protein
MKSNNFMSNIGIVPFLCISNTAISTSWTSKSVAFKAAHTQYATGDMGISHWR